MPRFMRSYSTDDKPIDGNGFEELAFLERAIDRRLAIFLVVCIVVIAGALASGSASLSAVGFSIGSFICWLLALSIILTTRKAGAVAHVLKKEGENTFAKIETKLYSKSIRWILGYIIPVFCAVILTMGSVASSVGWLNNMWFYKFKVESKIDEVTNKLPEIKIEKKDSVITQPVDNNFKPVDNVINSEIKPVEEKIQVSTTTEESKTAGKTQPTVKAKTPPAKPTRNFQPIDRVIK
jgi:hypothetical protein